MGQTTFRFKNNGNEEFNDVVYADGPFELSKSKVSVSIRPKSTHFWRFGIRLSKERNIPFFHPSDRHVDRNYPDINIGVGEWDKISWKLPNRLHLAQYYLPKRDHLLFRSDDYKSLGLVELSFSLSGSEGNTNLLSLSINAEGAGSFGGDVQIGKEYRYFQFFAWADKSDFELDCIINMDPSAEISNNLPQYWMLKLNPSSFDIPSFEHGEDVWFGAINTKYQRRPEYDLFQQVKEGDIVLGYAFGNYKSVVWSLQVVRAFYSDPSFGECIKLKISDVKRPPIPFQNFKSKLDQKVQLELSGNSPIRLIRISNEIYEGVIGASRSFRPPSHFKPSYTTEGNHHETEDQLGFRSDIDALSTVISLRNIHPPLAIGLFGNWGSGKSFFMEKLADRIDTITKGNDPENIHKVVQVKFNSWHYSDANLWASLASQIFESLHDYAQKREFGEDAVNAIYKYLHITGHQLEETKKKLSVNQVQANNLKERKESVEETIKLKKEALDTWKARDFVKIVFNDPYIKEDFQNIKSQFEVEKLIDNIHQIDEKFTEIDSVTGQLMKSIALLKQSKGKWKWIWILAILFAVLAWLAMGPLKVYIQDFVRGEYIMTGLIVAWMTKAISILRPYFKKVTQFYKRLKSLKEKVEKEKEKVRLSEHDEVDRLQKDIVQLSNQKQGLELQQQQLEEKRGQLQNEIKEIGSGKQLANFLAGKSLDEAYVKQLGIVSSIRKDFAKLNELFQSQKLIQNREKELITEVQIDRIVLYIDDLDRCNEHVVIKVLEAIHLLLAFPLFVVVVGVDPRWLNNAVDQKLGTLFRGKENEDNSSLDPARCGTSYDYLEKIFQIPFAIKPISRRGQQDLIRYLMKDEMESEEKNVNSSMEQNNASGTEPSSRLSSGAQSKIKDPDPMVQENVNSEAGDQRMYVKFHQEEMRFIQALSPLFAGSPRSVRRYVNIYRIVKSHRELIIDNQDDPNEYLAVMFLLAVLVGENEKAVGFFNKIRTESDNTRLEDLLGKFVSDTMVKKIRPLIGPIGIPSLKDVLVTDLKRNMELVSRFSFRPIY